MTTLRGIVDLTQMSNQVMSFGSSIACPHPLITHFIREIALLSSPIGNNPRGIAFRGNAGKRQIKLDLTLFIEALIRELLIFPFYPVLYRAISA